MTDEPSALIYPFARFAQEPGADYMRGDIDIDLGDGRQHTAAIVVYGKDEAEIRQILRDTCMAISLNEDKASVLIQLALAAIQAAELALADLHPRPTWSMGTKFASVKQSFRWLAQRMEDAGL